MQARSRDIFAANVRILREGAGWTQEELGRKLRPENAKPALVIVAAERNTTSPGLDTVDGLAEIFAMSAAQLICPLPCPRCAGQPAPGTMCLVCTTSAPLPAGDETARRYAEYLVMMDGGGTPELMPAAPDSPGLT